MNDLKTALLDVARSHATALRAENELKQVELLRAEITLLEDLLNRARKEIAELKVKVRGFT